MNADTSSRSLLAGLDAGDAAAWGSFADRHRSCILAVARTVGDIPPDAVDAVVLRLVHPPDRREDAVTGTLRTRITIQIQQAARRWLDDTGAALDPVARCRPPAVESEISAIARREWLAVLAGEALERLAETVSPSHLAIFQSLRAGDSPDTIAYSHGLDPDTLPDIKADLQDQFDRYLAYLSRLYG